MGRPERHTPRCDRDAVSVSSPRYHLDKTPTCKGAGVPPGAAANSAREYGMHHLEKRVAGDVSRYAVPPERLTGRRIRSSTIATVASETSKLTETSIDMFGLLIGSIKLGQGLMRTPIFLVAASLTCWPSLGVTQQQSQTVGRAPPPSAAAGASVPSLVDTAGAAPRDGTPLQPATKTGLDKVADDGISTKVVKAVPCGTAARETDGFTTCIGIPDERPRRRIKHR
jgi:hypothetical protein